MEDKKISEAVELLYKGAKMLSYYCPECKVPLFKDKDRIFCPSCKRDVVFESDIHQLKQDVDIKTNQDRLLSKNAIQTTYQTIQPNELEKVFKDAISSLALKLRSVEDTENLKEIVELIDKLTNLIEKLKRLKYI